MIASGFVELVRASYAVYEEAIEDKGDWATFTVVVALAIAATPLFLSAYRIRTFAVLRSTPKVEMGSEDETELDLRSRGDKYSSDIYLSDDEDAQDAV